MAGIDPNFAVDISAAVAAVAVADGSGVRLSKLEKKKHCLIHTHKCHYKLWSTLLGKLQPSSCNNGSGRNSSSNSAVGNDACMPAHTLVVVI